MLSYAGIYKANRAQIEHYYNALVDLPLTKGQRLKLIAEIGRLQMYNSYINSMTPETLNRPLPGIVITKQSKINEHQNFDNQRHPNGDQPAAATPVHDPRTATE